MSSCPLPLESLSPAVQRSVGPKAPAPLRMMAARGLAPMPPVDLVTTQYVLSFDADEKVAAAATGSLAGLDARIANAVLSDPAVPPPVLGYLMQTLVENDAYLEKLLLNPSAPTAAFAVVAADCSEAICELIANNQARITEHPDIVRGLIHNDKALKSTVDRVVDFLVRSGVILEGLRPFEEALFRLDGKARLEAAAQVEIPASMLDDRFAEEAQPERRLIEEDEDEEEAAELTLEQQIRVANVAQKVAFATKGNKQVRSMLMRDTNRVVALAAVTSPCITEPEIVAAAQSRTVHADVIGHICRDKKNNWVRNYNVKLALVSNPKTPLPDAMRMVPMLNKRDLRTIAKSKNVPMAVRNSAARLSKPR